MIYQACAHRVSVRRATSLVLDAVTVAATLSADRQPVQAAILKATVSGGTTGSGTVTIAGTVGGSSDSEVLTFTANGTKRTTKRFTAIDASGITTSGLADEATKATLQVEAVGRDGSPQRQTYELVADYPANISQQRQAQWPAANQGTHEVDQAVVSLPYALHFSPRMGDLLRDRDTSDDWLVQGVRVIRSASRPSHWECHCTRYAS